MGNIVLSASVRQNLLALQNTAQLMSTTQNRLATGKKVNSALDNPANFFTSQSLSNRSNDLSALLDSIGQAQKTLEAADKGLTALTKLVESAKSVATQARQAPQASAVTYGQISVAATNQAETLGSFTASAYAAPTANGSIAFTVTVNGTARNLTANVTSGDSAATVAAAMQAAITADNGAGGAAGHATVTTSGGNLKIDAVDADTDVTITASARTAEVGLTVDASTNRSINSTSLLDRVVAAGGTSGSSTLTVAVNGGSNQTITFGTGAGQVSTIAELNTALVGIAGVTASISGTSLSFSVASSSTQNSLTLTGSTGVTTALGITNGTTNGVSSTSQPNATRTSLQADYNNILSQIDALAKDASYNGINLLYGDNLKVTFNELSTSSLTITGVKYDASGLGLSSVSGPGFQSDSTVDSTISALSTALSTLRTQASKFGSQLTTVQIRQDFTKNLVNTLTTGSDALVLADTNEEGANMLALQTRQQLSTTALSLSSQADQAVLRLFG
ncbi:MAG: flagellin [Variibacter sp.]|nr:flagellin [Variibacter sp.]